MTSTGALCIIPTLSMLFSASCTASGGSGGTVSEKQDTQNKTDAS
jgi:hypothetical protein